MAKSRTIAPATGSGSTRSTRLILWGVMIYATLSLGHLAVQEYRLLYQGHILRSEKASTEEKGRKLREEIEYAKTPQGVERLARENLGMARAGEQPVRFVPPQRNM